MVNLYFLERYRSSTLTNLHKVAVIMSKGKERASYYDDEEEGGIEEGQEEGSPTPEAATDAEPVVKHPTYQGWRMRYKTASKRFGY